MSLPLESPFTDALIRAQTFSANLLIAKEINEMIERESFLLEWIADCKKVGTDESSATMIEARRELLQIKQALSIVGSSQEIMMGVTA